LNDIIIIWKRKKAVKRAGVELSGRRICLTLLSIEDIITVYFASKNYLRSSLIFRFFKEKKL